MPPITVTVDSRVRVPLAGLEPSVVEALRRAFEHQNPAFPDSGPAFEATWEEADGELLLPRGGMARVRAGLRAGGVAFQVSDARLPGDYRLLDDAWGGEMPAHNVALWDFQERIIDAILEKHNCLIEATTGSGKTTAAIGAIARIGYPALVVVNTGGLMEQWVERVARELGVAPERVGRIGGGVKRTAPVTVAMQQTLARGIDPRWLRTFGTFVFDECDLASAPTYLAVTTPWPATYRVGVTATVKRHDRREYLVRDLFGEVVAGVTRDEAIAKGRIVGVEVRVIPTGFDAPWFRAAAVSNNKFRLFAAHKKLQEAMWKDPERNRLAREVVVEHVARGDQVLVLSSRREHCEALHATFAGAGIPTGLMLGGDKAEFDRVRADVLTGAVRVVVGTDKAIGRGQDFPAIAVGVATMPIANNKTLTDQIAGRLCRAPEGSGKTGGVLYVLVDEVSGKKPIENLDRWHGGTVVRGPGGDWVPAAEYLAAVRGIRRGKGA